MKKTICVAIVLMVLILLPAGADNPGRIRQLESEVKNLRTEVKTLKNEVANLESIVNYILSGDFANQVCQSCQQ
jgi:outer membrane murein-binding lipoprotein Lpp